MRAMIKDMIGMYREAREACYRGLEGFDFLICGTS